MTDTDSIKQHSAFSAKLRDYKELVKFTLNITVVFSSVMAYLLVPNIEFNLKMVLLLALGGFLVTGCANTINQIYEKESDALMKQLAVSWKIS